MDVMHVVETEITLGSPPHGNIPQAHGGVGFFRSKGSTALLGHYFEQVWVVNLERRKDRLDQFWSEIKKARWPFRRPQVFSAIEGDKVGVPKFWQTGGGSYGCMRSHLAILERALQDDVERLLVMEDDAIFMDTFDRDVEAFLGKVPYDWQCLMLGGQHVNSQPFEVAPGVVRAGAGGGIQRTHCYALRGIEIMQELYLTWANAAVHCDWVMGPCTAKFNTYAPDPFLVGQSAGDSDISGACNPPKFWRSPTGLEPVIVLYAPRLVMEGLRNKGWHAGFSRNPTTGTDEGLSEIFADMTLDLPQRKTRLRHWIEMIQGEVVSMTEPAICTVWHPSATAEMVREVVKGRVLEISADTIEAALQQLPEDIRVCKSWAKREGGNIPVVLLRSSRSVMEVLRDEGWHSGNWRDEVTGLDNGVRRLFATAPDRVARSEGLLAIVQTLHEEVRHSGRGIVTLWHDEITPDMLDRGNIEVFEITAANANEAKTRLKELTDGRTT